MIFTPDKYYLSRAGKRYQCVRGFGSLPNFVDDDGNWIVQAPDGRFRFDGQDGERDIVAEDALSNAMLDHRAK